MARTAKSSRTRKASRKRPIRKTAARKAPAKRRVSAWTVDVDEQLSIHGDGALVTPRWGGNPEDKPDDDEVVALALRRIHELEQQAYDAARRLKDDEPDPSQRKEIGASRRDAHRDAMRLRSFVRIMEDRD